jgi:hypothetical protein
VFGRFVMGVRAFLFPLAGSARMPYATFLVFDSMGALMWVGVFTLAGYSVGWQVDGVKERYRAASAILAGVLGTAAAIYLLVKLYRRWRHGSGSVRSKIVFRLEGALRPRSRYPSAPFVSTPEVVPGERDRTDQEGTEHPAGTAPRPASLSIAGRDA